MPRSALMNFLRLIMFRYKKCLQWRESSQIEHFSSLLWPLLKLHAYIVAVFPPPPPLFWHPMLFTIWRRSQLESNDLKSLLQQPKGPFLCHHRPLETLNACKCKKKALLFSHFLLSQYPHLYVLCRPFYLGNLDNPAFITDIKIILSHLRCSLWGAW